MPQEQWSDKRERQYEHIKESALERGESEDVAEAISFLGSDSAAGLNGQVLRVCGQSLVGA